MERTCQHCGKPIGAEAIGGLCPECLMKMGLGIGTEATGMSPHGKRPFVPSTIAELAPLFPRFEIVSLIGQGGMGAVYKARQKELERVVALKILPPGVGEDSGFADRFAREAKAMARLNHPGIVTIHDFGCAEGLYYLIMEFVDGVSLGQLMRTGRVSPREALAIVPQICDALQYAHDQGIVHRDIKPENILLDRQGRVKVADFGLAKLIGALDEPQVKGAVAGAAALTEAGKVMGTPSYMAPEQMGDPGAVDHRADIYALGVVFYQMLTGELPSKPIEAPSSRVRIDVRLDDVVLCALEKEPERRYQQVSQIKTAVETIAHTSTPDKTKDESRTGSGTWPGSGLGAVRRVRGRVLAATVALLVIALVSFVLVRSRRAARAEMAARAAEMKMRLTRQITEPGMTDSQPLSTSPKQMPEWVKMKPLADWISDLQNPDPKIQSLAGRAIAEMGTNALPEFLRILGEKEPSAEARSRHYQTAEALRFIGPGLKSAIPAFTALIKGGDEETAYSGSAALAFTTPVVPEAFTALTNGLVDPEARVRDACGYGVGLLLGNGSSTHLAEAALPALVNNLSDKADYVRADAAASLMMYAQRQHEDGRDAKADMIIPPLINLLHDRYSWARIHGAGALAQYGTEAKSAIPSLSNLLNDPDAQVRSAATTAVRSITASQTGNQLHSGLPQPLPQVGAVFYFVSGGGVAIPGRRVFQPGLTAMAAIKACGGFTDGAIKTKAELTRAGSNAPVVVNFTAIEQGNALDPEIMPGDRLWVPAPQPSGP